MTRAAPTYDTSLPDLRFTVPLDAARLLRARERVRDFLDRLEVRTDIIDEIILAVEEACTNAVRHSCARDPMEICLSREDGGLRVRVKDCGRGFDVDSFDRDVVPDVMGTGGRGLFLMSRLMDEMELTVDRGLEVRLLKRRALPDVSPVGEMESRLEPPVASEAGSYRDVRRRTLLDELGEAFVALDWGYRYSYANAAFLRLLHVKEADLLGRSLWELFPYLADTPAGPALREAMELGRSSIVEYQSPRVRGWLEQRVYPTSYGVSMYIREITSRKRKELERDEYLRALRLSEAATALQNRVLDGIRTILEASVTAASEEGLGATCLRVAGGLTGGRLGLITAVGGDGRLRDVAVSDLGREGCALAGEGGHSHARGLCGSVLRAGESVVTNSPADHADAAGVPDGHPALTAFLGVPLKLRDRIVGIIAMIDREGGYGDEQRLVLEGLAPVIAQAIERRRADVALRESWERYRLLFEALDEGVALHEMLYDEAGRPNDYRFLEANPAFGRLTGLDHRAIIGRTVREVLPGIEPGWIDLYARVVETQKGERFEAEAAALGSWYAGYAYPLGDDRFGVAFTDVTERKRTERGRELP